MGIFLNGSTTNPTRIVFNGNDNIGRVIFRHNNVDTVVWQAKLPPVSNTISFPFSSFDINGEDWSDITYGSGRVYSGDNKRYVAANTNQFYPRATIIYIDSYTSNITYNFGASYAGASCTLALKARSTTYPEFTLDWGSRSSMLYGQTVTTDANGTATWTWADGRHSCIPRLDYDATGFDTDVYPLLVNPFATGTERWKETNSTADVNGYAEFIIELTAVKNGHIATGSATITSGFQIAGSAPITINVSEG